MLVCEERDERVADSGRRPAVVRKLLGTIKHDDNATGGGLSEAKRVHASRFAPSHKLESGFDSWYTTRLRLRDGGLIPRVGFLLRCSGGGRGIASLL